ncbi:MAG: DivIVA domain-containing protein [Ilumatobacteraceae bacterium]|nr:DivIVA domain-containing protein [Ilumatobacter sp.]MCB0983181.1 DivIVA domain-containing protein [Ilumatobacter sp.]
MEMSPQTIRSTGFRTVKKGYDPSEVDAFKEQVAAAVETSQNQATAMEARARAAVAKLQEISQQVGGKAEDRPAAAPAPAAAPTSTSSGDTEMISRTLLLAQRTADATVADAKAEAETILGQARDEAGRVLDGARAMAAKTVEEAKGDARRAADDERVRAENEVQALLARRDFLLSDVDHLEQYIQAQRERLRDAAVQIQELVERVPGGLGDMRRPLLSASADAGPVTVAPSVEQPAPAAPPPMIIEETAPAAEPAAEQPAPEPAAPAVEPSPEASLAPAPSWSPAEPEADRVPRLDAATLANDPIAKESVWRMLDEEVANTQAAQGTFESLSLDVTAEVPVVRPAPQAEDPFRIGGDELQ